MLYVCVRDVMDVVFSVCIVTRGTVGACMGSVSVSSCRCLCLVCILWQFSMLVEDARGDHMEVFPFVIHLDSVVRPQTRGDNMVCMWVMLKRWKCVVCASVANGAYW